MKYISKKIRQLGHAYALWRIQPTTEESRAYNHTDRILLTFDDYADEATIHRFLEILQKENIKAIFFPIGEWTEKNKNLVGLIRNAGHWIGNHTYSHQKLTELSVDAIKEEIKRGTPGKLLRPPYGAYNERVRKIAHELGYHIAFWTTSGDDWEEISATEIQERVFSELQPGGCVLLHLNGIHTLEAIPGLIHKIRERGFEFCNDGTELSL